MDNSNRKLIRIQKDHNLNEVYAVDDPGAGNANHEYLVLLPTDKPDVGLAVPVEIAFQHGPRNEPNSVHGVLDTDLLEIVRDRLKGFQSGEYACRENACALTHVEEALMWLNKRVTDRAQRGVLGTNEK